MNRDGTALTADRSDQDAGQGVITLVLSFSSPETLEAVVRGVERQSVRPDRIIIVDNAGDPAVSEQVASSTTIPLLIERLQTNLGPAGGWAYAFNCFLGTDGGKWAWLLDDDAVPAPDCLEKLLTRGAEEQSEYTAPVVLDSVTGKRRTYPSWCGPLLRKDAIERGGTPREELVWWAEDTEYLMLRMEGIGLKRVVVRDAVVTHHGVRRTRPRSPAKIYYETRNGLWMRLYVRQQWRLPRMWWRIIRIVPRYIVLAFRSPHTVAALRAVGMGLWDGTHGRLGRRWELADGPLRPAE